VARRDEAEASQTRMPRGLTLKEARELERGNAILQLQSNVQTLTTSLADVLARFKDDPRGPRRRERVQPKNDLTSDHSSFSQRNTLLNVGEGQPNTMKMI